MRGQLFFQSWYATWDSIKQQAVAEVNGLDRALFSDPRLGGELQKKGISPNTERPRVFQPCSATGFNCSR